MQTGGSMAASDENAKTDIRSGKDNMSDFYDQIRSSNSSMHPSSVSGSGGGDEEKSGGSGMDMSQAASMFGSSGGSASMGDMAGKSGGYGGGGSAGYGASNSAAASSFSDERTKTQVNPGERDLKSFYDKLGTHSYEYKDAFKDNGLAGPGRHVSPMAQELEKSDVGRGMVKDTPQGKVVDYGKGFGAMLAGQAYLHGEIQDLKRALGRGHK
jgi:hypothetical protein